MKKVLLLLSLAFMLIVAGSAVLSSCTKVGPVGPPGLDGTNGKDGENGKDAVITCGSCHSKNDTMTSIMKEYELSVHYESEAFTEGYSGSCAPCHSSQGFKEEVKTGFFNTQGFTAPSPVNCRTCHKIHETYTKTDWDLRTVADVRSRMDSTNVKFSYGKGNLCANCHQGRVLSTKPDIITAGATFKLSNRLGPHHNPAANLIAGYKKSGAFEFTGAFSYVTTPHAHATVTDGCVKCHKAPGIADMPGGHTFKMSFSAATVPVKPTDYTYSLAQCAPCHNATDALAKLKNTQTTVVTLLATLKAKLIATNCLDPATDLGTANTVNAKYAAALINYKFAEEDKSFGVHNPPYIIALLQNSIAVFP
jgi:hypothetical protein